MCVMVGWDCERGEVVGVVGGVFLMVYETGIVGPYTFIFHRATWPFLKIDMRHVAYGYC